MKNWSRFNWAQVQKTTKIAGWKGRSFRKFAINHRIQSWRHQNTSWMTCSSNSECTIAHGRQGNLAADDSHTRAITHFPVSLRSASSLRHSAIESAAILPRTKMKSFKNHSARSDSDSPEESMPRVRVRSVNANKGFRGMAVNIFLKVSSNEIVCLFPRNS
jgi:hypothetical protein